MKCYLRRLIYAVSLLPLITLSLDLESLIKEKLKKRFGNEVKLKSYEILTKIPEDYKSVELKVYKNHPRGFIYFKNKKVGTVRLNLLWKCEVLVSKRDINPGERLSKINVERREIYLGRCKQIKEPVENFISKRFIKKGEVIKRRDLKKDFLVKRGEKVRVYYEKGNLFIVFDGKALDNGFMNENVRVLSPFSDRVIRGKVIGEGAVKILD
ncbi:flagellar basal body P-ring formation chaperone FlgA [Aquifex pyrophilus]